MRIRGVLVLVLTAAAAAAGVLSLGRAAAAEPRAARLSVVATTGIIGDVARAVGGAHVEVHVLMGEGVDPHLYKPTRADMKRMRSADVIFYNGLMLEGKMTEALERIASDKPVHAVTGVLVEKHPDRLLGRSEDAPTPGDPAGAEPEPEPAGRDDAHAYDPHVWMDPRRWAYASGAVRNVLVDLAPDHRRDFIENAGGYNRQLKRIDWYAEQILHLVPEEHRVLITAHDAFRYFGDRYGYEVLGVQGISTDAEAGLADMERLIDVIVERKIPAVFVESSVSDRNVKALIEGAAARGHTVRLGGSLFSDALGAPGTYRGGLVGMLDHNASTIAHALGAVHPDHDIRCGIDGQLCDGGAG